MSSDLRSSKRAGVCLLVGLALLANCANASGMAAPGTLATETFSYTGSPQTYTVPAAVGALTGGVVGANGGNGGVGRRAQPTVVIAPSGPTYGEPTNGGRGGSAAATFPVTEGQTLTIEVGGAGSNGPTGDETEPAAGGYNSGAPGGTAGSVNSDGGGGGGSSEILSGETPLLVGGGGGGGGGTFVGRCGKSSSEVLGNGGNGGETGAVGNGEDGASATENEEEQIFATTTRVRPAVVAPPPGQGGTGGSSEHPGGPKGHGLPGESGEVKGGGGGGGGGGYYGGGGGAFGACNSSGALTGGGGGGGSDYAAPQSSEVLFTRSANSSEEGNGQVQLSYYVPYPTATQATPTPSSAVEGETVTLAATVTASISCSGTVQFEIDGTPVGAPVTVQQGGAQTTITAPAAGNHPITATYSGTPSNATEAGCLPSTSDPSTLTVPYSTTTQATASPTTATVGETVTLTATVKSVGPCTGTVQFFLDGTPVGQPAVLKAQTAETTIPAPSAGAHQIVAAYSGNPATATAAGCLPSTSSPSALTTVAKTGPAATITPAGESEALTNQPTICRSVRHFTIHLLLSRKQTLLSAHVYVDGKLVKRLGNTTRNYRLNLAGRPYATITVTLTASEPDGTKVTGKRIYHTCRAHKLPGHGTFTI